MFETEDEDAGDSKSAALKPAQESLASSEASKTTARGSAGSTLPLPVPPPADGVEAVATKAAAAKARLVALAKVCREMRRRLFVCF